MNGLVRVAVVVIASALALAGCVRVQVDLTLTPDETVDGTMVLALESGIGALLDTTDRDLAEQVFGEAEDAFDDSVVTPYTQDNYVGRMVTFDGQPIGNLALGSGDFTIQREGDYYVVNGTIDSTVPAQHNDIPATAQMSLSVTFPGPVYQHNGSLKGRTVTWDLTNAPEQLHAVGATAAVTGSPTWLATAIGIAILAGIALLLLVIMHHRGDPTPTHRAPSNTRPVTGPPSQTPPSGSQPAQRTSS